MSPRVTAFFDPATYTITYVAAEPDGAHAVVIDTVLDFDRASGRTGTDSADKLIAFVREQGLTIDWILETHAHADHLTAAPYVKEALGGRIGVGAAITGVQRVFAALYNIEAVVSGDGAEFDHLFEDGERVAIGAMELQAMATPGHTPACTTYAVGDAAFTGDTIFMPDFGTARCDFPDGSAAQLYHSIRRILSLPPETRIFVGHDYAPGERDYAWETTVAAERAGNIHVRDGIDEAEFVRMRTERDTTLEAPGLLLPAIQVNIRAGRLPEPEANGIAYMKLPIDAF
jgi:glyoxylase-like metal-dependent hydrolase (beta-lactamase superfamily II)